MAEDDGLVWVLVGHRGATGGPIQVSVSGDHESERIETADTYGRQRTGEGVLRTLLRIPSAVLELKSLGDERTRLSYEIEFSLLSKLGTLGYPIIKHKAAEMSKTFAGNLRKELVSTP